MTNKSDERRKDILKITNNTIKKKFLINAVIFTIILIFLSLISINVIDKWHKKTVTKNSVLCNATARQLLHLSRDEIKMFEKLSYFSASELSVSQLTHLDTTLSNITKDVLSKNVGLEGGFYFHNFDKFEGYSYPTSRPPKPVYGPPPRSYNIIREQCLKSIDKRKDFIELHGFDPAVFPLMTLPIYSKEKIIGVIWVRIHIERELPLIKLQNVINISAIILIISLLFVIWFVYQLRNNIQSIQDQLGEIHNNPNYRLQNRGKLFSAIVYSINLTLGKLQSGNQERRHLEHKLLQREKMASIGRIVAGVAHEVRTPLAIIKTRIQMWQQLIKNKEDAEKNQELITDSAMEMVVNETNRLSNLIKRLLIFSRPINKKMISTNIFEQLKETVKILHIQKKNEDIKFIFNNINIPNIEADINSIQQVFINIISNSMEAMPNGGCITINTQTIEDNSKIRIEFIDEGSGIPDHIIDKMLELFVTSKPSGVGLGLSISNEIIKAHNGEIFFKNRNQGGAKCTIILPIKHQ